MSFEPLLLTHLLDLHKNHCSYKIILCDDDTQAQNIQNHVLELAQGFLNESEVLHLPGFVQTGVFKYESSKKIIAKRLQVAQALIEKSPRIIVASVAGFVRAFPGTDWLKKNRVHLHTEQIFDIEDLLNQLSQLVYTEVNHVHEVGEYAVRGSIVDIWTPGQQFPTRVEFFDDTIKQIKSFRAYDQKSFLSLEHVYLLPAREFVWPIEENLDEKCEQFNTQILKQKVEGINRSNLLEDLKSSIPFPGIDDISYMFTHAFPTFASEYTKSLDQDSNIEIAYLSSKEEIQTALSKISELYKSAERSADNKNILVAKFNTLFPDAVFLQNKLTHEVIDSKNAEKHEDNHEFELPSEIAESFLKTKKDTFQSKANLIKSFLNTKDIHEIVICASNQDSAQEVLGLFSKYITEISETDSNDQIQKYSFEDVLNHTSTAKKLASKNPSFYTKLLDIEGAFFFPKTKTIFVSEKIIRGRQRFNATQNNTDLENSQTQSAQISQIFLSSQFSDFSEDDLVVHVQHGISRFKGLATIKVGDILNDFLVLEFSGHDKIYVPVNKLNLVQKYIGASNSIQLDSLKTKAWTKKKDKIKKDVEQLAQKLLEHHAKQTITPGTAFAKIGEDYISFLDAFPYEDTPDQSKVTQEIMHDMGLPKAMDRLLCGDVGFGKTEVAMRACYRAILDGKQAAWLVPTTVLAHQHYRTLQERFGPFGVKVQLLDRATSSASQALEDLKKGATDILIGTHRILAKDIQFRDLGLLVVDEEQHFGVLQKEKMKTMSYGIDVLTLTATPIPRTLQMALVGIRELSLLTTPPKSRLATKTFVCPFEDKTIVEAIRSEIARGGQIFYVHNRVEELEGVYQYLTKLLPNVRIAIGHGKMQQNELEKIILQFLDRKFDLFLCTTIVEAGIDMPNVNTILIQNADNLGLAQLYQLRGRVGRRSTRGNAYFLVDPDKFSKNSDGMKRLEVLKDHQELGSGFVIASHDLEMRGSGEILGDEQSGKVKEIGLETYLQMLDEAIKKLGGVKVERKAEIDLQIPLSLQIPDSYIESARERLLIYRRFFGARDEASLIALQKECEDRFGPIPEEVYDVIEISRIRRLLSVFGALSFTVGELASECRLDQALLQSTDENAEAFVKRLLALCNRSKDMRITQDGRLIFALTSKHFATNKQESLEKLKKTLTILAGSH